MKNERFAIKLGQILADARHNANMSQEEAAKRIGVTRSCITNWERGIRNIYAEDLYKLCDIYHITVKDIYEQTHSYLGHK